MSFGKLCVTRVKGTADMLRNILDKHIPLIPVVGTFFTQITCRPFGYWGTWQLIINPYRGKPALQL